MSRAKVDFLERKAKAEETVKWLWADVQRAEGNGEPAVMIKIEDMKEMLSYIEAVKYRESSEYGGTHLGYGRPDDMARLKRGEIKGCMVLVKKSEKFCVPVGFTDRIQIAKPRKHHEMPVAKPEKVLEDSTC